LLLQNPEPIDQHPANLETWKRFRVAVSPTYGNLAKEGDAVGQKLSEFKTKMENLCRPIIDREYRKEAARESILGAVSESIPQGPISN
jgi:hypothetical protein